VTAPDARDLAGSAAALLAIDPATLGGAALRTRPSPALDRWLALYRALEAPVAPWRKLPAGVAPARLTGGLDLAGSLAAGRPLFERGLLAEADGGVIVAPMGERIEPEIAALLSSALDEKCVRTERDGFSRTDPAQFSLIMIDESASDNEAVPARLSERLAFDLSDLSFRSAPDRLAIERARQRLSEIAVPDDMLQALATIALRSGVFSVRALRFAVAAARASAALFGRSKVSAEDAALAAALVIAPRALAVPDDTPEENAPPPNEAGDSDNQSPKDSGGPIDDRIVSAVKAAIDASVLSGRLSPASRARRATSAGKSGASRKSARQGRPYGSRRGDPSNGGRLALIDTLRAAAPWQKIRGRIENDQPIAIRRDDLRIARLKRREQSLTIFVVDASGSAALQRLGETKGAIEHLFARSYSRRDEVALIAFRKAGAELLVPPTRSLVRARRLLAELPGGGGTPLAAGIDAAALLASQAAARGRTPSIVLMTDGRANVALNGEGGREAAKADAMAAAQRLRARNVRVLLFDNSMRPEPLAAALAAEMGAQYLPLPQADARLVAATVAQR
jgi:magnesium chelatase subunit D